VGLAEGDLQYTALETNTPVTLAGRTAEPLQLGACEVARSVGVLRGSSWLTGGMAKVGSQGCGAKIGPLAKTSHSHRCGK